MQTFFLGQWCQLEDIHLNLAVCPTVVGFIPMVAQKTDAAIFPPLWAPGVLDEPEYCRGKHLLPQLGLGRSLQPQLGIPLSNPSSPLGSSGV